jgi:hypothetical protein
VHATVRRLWLLAGWLIDGVRFVGDDYPRLVDGAWQVKGLMRDSGM